MKGVAHLLLLVTVLVGLASLASGWSDCSAKPRHPKWPSTFSSTVEWRANHRPYHTYFRIFWDEKHNRARTGGFVEYKGRHYKMEALFFGEKQKAYYIFFDKDQVKCFHKDMKMNITGIDLEDADFQGTSVVEYHPVYHWETIVSKKKEKIHLRFFDTQEDREIKKIGYYVPDEEKAGTMTYHEVNYGTQANSLFKIPKLIADQCNEKLEQTDYLDMNDPMEILAHLVSASR